MEKVHDKKNWIVVLNMSNISRVWVCTVLVNSLDIFFDKKHPNLKTKNLFKNFGVETGELLNFLHIWVDISPSKVGDLNAVNGENVIP